MRNLEVGFSKMRNSFKFIPIGIFSAFYLFFSEYRTLYEIRDLIGSVSAIVDDFEVASKSSRIEPPKSSFPQCFYIIVIS